MLALMTEIGSKPGNVFGGRENVTEQGFKAKVKLSSGTKYDMFTHKNAHI